MPLLRQDGAMGHTGEAEVPRSAAPRRPGPAATARSNIRDVAERAGVSVATVSRVLADHPYVREGTRERVLAAVAELDYIANGHALALTGRTAGVIALIASRIMTSSFAEAAYGAESVTAEHKRVFALFSSGGELEAEEAIVERLREQRASAAIWLGGTLGGVDDMRFADYAERLATVGTRLVLCGRPRLGLPPEIAVVEYDNEQGMAELVGYLLGLGHRRILFVGHEPARSSSAARYAGYLLAHRRAGVAIHPELTRECEFEIDHAQAATDAALDAGIGFTAVVGAADFLAVGVVRALAARGLRIPGDVSVAGFDDMPFAGDLLAPLTTVRVPFVELGRCAAEVALGLREPPAAPLATHLVVRSSTAPIASTPGG